MICRVVVVVVSIVVVIIVVVAVAIVAVVVIRYLSESLTPKVFNIQNRIQPRIKFPYKGSTYV